jgi:hypothetical protein
MAGVDRWEEGGLLAHIGKRIPNLEIGNEARVERANTHALAIFALAIACLIACSIGVEYAAVLHCQ